MNPKFLSLARVLRIHRDSIQSYGGEPTVRDMNLLESAIAQPRAAFGGQFQHEDLPAMAAAYLFHIVSNHPFVDGNKRTGAMAGFIFAHINGLLLTATEEAYVDLTLKVARGEILKSEVTEFFRAHLRSR